MSMRPLAGLMTVRATKCPSEVCLGVNASDEDARSCPGEKNEFECCLGTIWMHAHGSLHFTSGKCPRSTVHLKEPQLQLRSPETSKPTIRNAAQEMRLPHSQQQILQKPETSPERDAELARVPRDGRRLG